MSDLGLFDYDVLASEIRELVQEHTVEIRRLARRSAEDIIEIGDRLSLVKTGLEHGQFEQWISDEFSWSYRAAARFMQVAETFKTANLADLQIAPSALYALASGSTPDFIQTEILEMARETGQPITHKAVKERLEAHKAEAVSPVTEQQIIAPADAVDNAAMSPKKKGAKAPKEPYVPLPVEYEEREHEDGTTALYPKLPDSLKKLEIKQKDWGTATKRFGSTAHSVLVGLGQLRGYELEDLKDLLESPEGRAEGASVRIHLIKEAMRELLEKWDAMDGKTRTVDAEPLFDDPPKAGLKTLDALN